MSEDGEHEGLEVILTSLDSLMESIEAFVLCKVEASRC